MFSQNNFGDSKETDNDDLLTEMLHDNLITRRSSSLLYKEDLENIDIGKCPICYDTIKILRIVDGEIKPNPNVTTTPCNHSFCYKCLSKHLEKNNKCPMCREKIYNKSNVKAVTTYEACYIINQSVNHLTRNINNIVSASRNLQDNNILLSSIKTCMYDAFQSFQRIQNVGDSDDEYAEDDDDNDT